MHPHSYETEGDILLLTDNPIRHSRLAPELDTLRHGSQRALTYLIHLRSNRLLYNIVHYTHHSKESSRLI
jgi:hypothetical protein